MCCGFHKHYCAFNNMGDSYFWMERWNEEGAKERGMDRGCRWLSICYLLNVDQA